MRLSRHLPTLLLTSAFLFNLPASAEASQSQASQSPAPQSGPVVVEDTSPADFPTTLSKLKAQLEADGWNLVAEIDLGARLAKKGVEIPGGLVILELTSGKNAVPLLKQDDTRYVSALMPCSVSVYGKSDGSVMVSRMNAGLMAGMLEPRVAQVMQKSAAGLDQTIARALTR